MLGNFFRNIFVKRQYPPTHNFWYSAFAGKTYSGTHVNEYKAMNYSAVFCAFTNISGTIGSLPLHLYQKNKDGSKGKVTQHPLYHALHDEFAPDITAMAGRETGSGHLLGWGNCFCEKLYDNMGRCVGLFPITPNRVEVRRIGGQLYYGVRVGAETKWFPRSKILHIPGLGFDGILGYSVLRMARESIGLGMATEEFGARFFGSGTHPGVIATHPGRLSQEAHESLKRDLIQKYSGLGKSHRLMLLEEGMDIRTIGIPPNDSQFLETRQFQITEIARWFNIPPHKLKDLSRATFSNIEEQGIDYAIDTIRPWLVRIEQNYNMQLLTREEHTQKRLFFEHSIDGLLRGNIQSRYQAYSIGRQNGWLSANDIREKENMNPIPGGDKYLIPLNMIDANSEVPQESIPNQQQRIIRIRHETRSIKERDRISKLFSPMFKNSAEQIIRIEGVLISKAVKKHLRSLNSFEDWLMDFYEKFPETIRKYLTPTFTSFAEGIWYEANQEIGEDLKITKAFEDFIFEYIGRYATRYADSSLGQLILLLDKDEPESAILQRTEDWKEKRPDKIARNETVRAGSAVAQFVFFLTGHQCEWGIRGDHTCPYCKALEGKRIASAKEFFLASGTEWEPEGAKNGIMKINGMKRHSPLHEGCDCFMRAV